MRHPLRILATRIRNKIILPYLVIVMCVAVAMTFVAIRLTVGALQDRLDNRLIEAGQVTSDVLVTLEDQQLGQLRAMVFTQGTAEAFRDQDSQALITILRPHWANANLYSLVAFDTTGQPLISWTRAASGDIAAVPQSLQLDRPETRWIVQQIVQSRTDEFGDKFSAFNDGRLFTAAPVRLNGRLVGGIMVGLPLDLVLERLQSRSQAGVTTLYDPQGRAVATTQVLGGNTIVPAIPTDVLEQLRAPNVASTPLHVQSIVALNGRDHQFAYSPLQIRRAMNGYFSVAVSRSFIVDAWARERLPLVAFALLLVLAVCLIGVLVSRQITRPLQELVGTARAVTHGDLQRRSAVMSRDEFGVLAQSFNQMTERLLHLYETSRLLSTHAQTESIVAQTHLAIQRLVPGAAMLALLEDQDGWSCYVGDATHPLIQGVDRARLIDPNIALTLAGCSAESRMVAIDSQWQSALQLPPQIQSVYCARLAVESQRVGLLLLFKAQPGELTPAVEAPVAAVVSMAATSLYQARLYLQVQTEGTRRQIILESIADGVVVCDAQQYVTLMNSTAEKLLAIYDWSERQYHFSQLPLTMLEESGALLSSAGQIETRYEAHGQVLRALSARLPSIEGQPSGEVIVLHNISEEVALDHAKTELIAMISHELRTPLTGILGSVDLLSRGLGGQLSPLQQELTDAALRQSRAMNALIDKAVLVANIESGMLQMEVQPTRVSDVVEAAQFALGSAHTAQIHVNVPAGLPPILADPNLLKVALLQLLDNAVKYGGSTPVYVEAQRTDSNITLLVRDEGPGIAAEQLPNLFRRLQRKQESYNSGSRGLGLGLMIARELVQRQGGTVNVQSELGHGSQFSITLPGINDAALLAA